MSAKTITITAEEYALLNRIYLYTLTVRDQGVQQFNRFPPGMRLAITTLAAYYREQGYDERGLPTGEHVGQLFEMGRRK